MGFKFNPLTGKLDLVSGTSSPTPPDPVEGCAIILSSCDVESSGEMELFDESCVAIKNGLASAYQRVINSVQVLSSGEFVIKDLGQVEVQNGSI